MVTSEQKEQCLSYVKSKYENMSNARASRIVGCSRKSKYYTKRMPVKDKTIKEAIEQVIGISRKGRMKVTKFVQKKHPEISAFKIRRVYEREGFSLSKKLSRRMKDNPKNPIEIPLEANVEWAMDFMSDSLESGKRIRTLNIIDHFNRECKGIEIDTNHPAISVIEFLRQVIEKYGTPIRVRTDYGPEFRSKRFQCWLQQMKIDWSKIQKGKPQQNAIIERFNKTYREDVLDANLFNAIEEAKKNCRQMENRL